MKETPAGLCRSFVPSRKKKKGLASAAEAGIVVAATDTEEKKNPDQAVTAVASVISAETGISVATEAEKEENPDDGRTVASVTGVPSAASVAS